jgi:uncharacterized protein YggU (UPF0235/DUF167 family)
MALLHVRVYPGARRTEFCGWFGEMPKVKVAERPVDGSANDALIRFLARTFELRPRQVRLLGGAMARTKRLELEGLTDQDVTQVLDRLNPR